MRRFSISTEETLERSDVSDGGGGQPSMSADRTLSRPVGQRLHSAPVTHLAPVVMDIERPPDDRRVSPAHDVHHRNHRRVVSPIPSESHYGCGFDYRPHDEDPTLSGIHK